MEKEINKQEHIMKKDDSYEQFERELEALYFTAIGAKKIDYQKD